MNVTRRTLLSLLCAFGLLLAVTATQAQTPTTGQITGRVVDPSGAVIPGATVSLTSPTGARRTTTTNDEGRYRFSLLPPGIYTVEVKAPGFESFLVEDIEAKITETTPVNVELQMAAQQQRVVVTAEPPLVESEDATRGEVIGEKALRQLPLPTRNFQQLLTLTTGTSSSVVKASELGRGDTTFSVNGQRTLSNSMVINGVDANSIGTGSTPNLAVPTTDALQEFIVQTSLYDASTGRNAGGIVSAVTKSGTNEIHGNAWYFIRNDFLNANNFFLNANEVEKPVYDRDQFGFTFGGPIKQDRVWYFLSYQGSREDNGTSLTNSLATVFVPGNLTDDRSPGGLAAVSASFGLGGFVHPTAAALLQARLPNGQFLIPSAPNPIPGDITPQAVTLPTLSVFDEDQFNANLDFQLSEANRAAVKFFWANNDIFQGLFSSFGTGNALQLPGFGADTKFNHRLISVQDTHVINPSLLNDARFGFSKISTLAVEENPFTSAQFGINTPLQNQFPGLTTLSVTNLFDIGPSAFQDNDAQVTTYTLADTLSWTKGNHSFKFGAEYKRHEVDLRFNVWTRGQVFFLGFLGNPFTDFLAGLSGLSIQGSGVNDRSNRANDFSWFIQDDWRIHPRFMLNVGLRYDYYGPFHETEGRFLAIDPAALQATQVFPGFAVITDGYVQASNVDNPLPGIPQVRKSLVDPDQNNFGPRLGFAWQPLARTSQLVVRGGYGLYYDRTNARLLNNQLLGFPYHTLAMVFATPITDPFVDVPPPSTFPLDFTNPAIFPFGGPPAFFNGDLVPASGLFPNVNNFRMPYIQHYNLTLQYEFIRDWLLDVGYVGSAGRKLHRLRTLNQSVAPGAAFTGPFSPGLSDLPVQAFGVHVMESSSNSSYNSLQLQLTKRYSSGLQFIASYTYSHSIDDYSGDPSGTSDNTVVPGDQVNLDNRGSSDFDRRHRFVFSYIYDLPHFYQGGSKAASLVVNDWQIAGIATFQSGTPFSVLTNANAFVQARADWVPGCTVEQAELGGSVTDRLGGFFDTTCFASATGLGNFGTTGRNILRGPDQRNIDFSIIKFFPIDEAMNLEFRTEFFNITNTPSFANPVNIQQSGNFGQVVETSTSARIIQFGLKFNF